MKLDGFSSAVRCVFQDRCLRALASDANATFQTLGFIHTPFEDTLSVLKMSLTRRVVFNILLAPITSHRDHLQSKRSANRFYVALTDLICLHFF
jgi:hypothetical protein